MPEHWKIEEKDIADVSKLCQPQLKTLWGVGLGRDRSILKLLVVGRKLGAPYLMYVVDAYTRAKMDSDNDTMSETDFASNNRHFKMLANLPQNRGNDPERETLEGIQSFLGRISPEIQLQQTTRIAADLEKTCQLILSAMEFVHTSASGNTYSCPFQFDACFAFKGSVRHSNKGFVGRGEYDDDDDDDDDDDEKGQVYESEDRFGDIQAKLNAEKLRRSMSKLTLTSRGFMYVVLVSCGI